MFSARTAICPSCSQTVELPHMQAQWRLACSFCKTRLEVAPNRASRFLASLSLLPLFTISLSRFASTRMHIFLIGALFGSYVVGLIAITVFWRWESRHPVLRIRQTPKPEIALNLNLKSPENIRTLY
jgi:uncharacterized paraquat-inducible protein A